MHASTKTPTSHWSSVSVLSLTSCSVVVLEAEGSCISPQKASHQPHPEDALGAAQLCGIKAEGLRALD